jgi:hypothetical protein
MKDTTEARFDEQMNGSGEWMEIYKLFPKGVAGAAVDAVVAAAIFPNGAIKITGI